MATVADLISLLDSKLLGHIGSLGTTGHTEETKKIEALNAGKEKVWQLLVAAGKPALDNWFAKTAALSFSTGSNSDALPADFHALLSVESTSAKMKQSHWQKESWQEARAQSANQDVAPQSTFWYLVNSTDVLIGPKPGSTLTATLHYIPTLSEWTGTGDDADVIPSPYHDAICNYAAAVLLASARAFDDSKFFLELWYDDQKMITGSGSNRQLGDDTSSPAFDQQA